MLPKLELEIAKVGGKNTSNSIHRRRGDTGGAAGERGHHMVEHHGAAMRNRYDTDGGGADLDAKMMRVAKTNL